MTTKYIAIPLRSLKLHMQADKTKIFSNYLHRDAHSHLKRVTNLFNPLHDNQISMQHVLPKAISSQLGNKALHEIEQLVAMSGLLQSSNKTTAAE